MSRIHCAISGLTFSCEHVPLVLTERDGYFHPIFALPYRKLYGLYSKHCAGHLTVTDSYLLFLAFLHSTDQIEWRAPCSLNPRDKGTISFVENNIQQLIRVIESTNCISIPSFKQPSFVVDCDNSQLSQVPNWIAAWNRNIRDFKEGYASVKLQEDLQKLENKLSYYLKSGINPENYSFAVASWACKAAEFPPNKAEAWCKLIRSCFNSAKMFSIPMSEIREVKEYCEENIEAGSIHFHALMSTLREGSTRHTDFLGLSTPNSLGYTLLPAETSKNQVEVEAIIAKAPIEEPIRIDYSSDIEFLKAKIAYKLALRESAKSRPKLKLSDRLESLEDTEEDTKPNDTILSNKGELL